MIEKRFERWNDHSCKVKDNQEDTFLNWEDVVDKLNEQETRIDLLEKGILDCLFEDKSIGMFALAMGLVYNG